MKKKKKWVFPVVSILVIALIAFLPRLLQKSKDSEETSNSSILSATAEYNVIETNLSGTGTLTPEDSVEVELPDGVEVTRYLVSNGDTVTAGTPLVTVDRVSVTQAIADCQEALDYIGSEIYGEEWSTIDNYLAAPGTGVVTAVYAQPGDDVVDIMRKYGSLATVDINGEDWNFVATSGTVRTINLTVGETVYPGHALIIFDDMEDTAAYDQYLAEHHEYEEMMDTLIRIYTDGVISATCDGIVSGIDEDEAAELEENFSDGKSTLIEIPEPEETASTGRDGAGGMGGPGGGMPGEMPEGMELPEGMEMPEGFPGAGGDASGSDGSTESTGFFGKIGNFFKNLYNKILGIETDTTSGNGTNGFPGNGNMPGFPGENQSGTMEAGESGNAAGSSENTGSASTAAGNVNSGNAPSGGNSGEAPAGGFSGSSDSNAPAGMPDFSGTAPKAEAGSTSDTVKADAAAYVSTDSDSDTGSATETSQKVIKVSSLTYTGEKIDTLVAETIADLSYDTTVQTYAQVTSKDGVLVATVTLKNKETKEETMVVFPVDQLDLATYNTVQKTEIEAGNYLTGDFSYVSDIPVTAVNSKFSVELRIPVTQSGGGGGGTTPQTGTAQTKQVTTVTSTSSTSTDEEEEDTLYSLEGKTIMSVTPQDTISISITIDELDILSVSLGQEARVTIDAVPGKEYIGKVTELNTSGTSNSGGNSKFTAVITMDRTEDLIDGMNASTLITIASTDSVLTIPIEALNDENGKTFVYTGYDKETGTLTNPVDVETGASDGIVVEIKSGLKEGDTVRYEYVDEIVLDTSGSSGGLGSLFGGLTGGGGGGGMGGGMPGGGGGMPGGGGMGGPGR